MMSTRGGWLVALASLAVGCAQGGASAGDDLAGAPIVALSDPGAPLPDLGKLGSSAPPYTARARAPNAPAFATTKAMPFGLVPCKKGAFCDDFEGPAPGARWTGAVASDGSVDFAGPSASFGVHAVHAMTWASGGAAYLKLHGAALGTQWVGALGFELRVDAVPSAVIGGPEIAVVDASGATTRIGFSVRPDGIALHQFFESCTGSSCTARSELVTDVRPGEWRHLVVAIETYGTTSSPYGRVEVSVDDGELLVTSLTVSPSYGRAEARAGITVADAVPATVRVDDVTFYAR